MTDYNFPTFYSRYLPRKVSQHLLSCFTTLLYAFSNQHNADSSNKHAKDVERRNERTPHGARALQSTVRQTYVTFLHKISISLCHQSYKQLKHQILF